MEQLRVLDGNAVRRALPMAKAVHVAHETFLAVAAGQAATAERHFVELDPPGMTVGLMPSGVGGDAALATVKVVTLVPGNAERGLPLIHGLVLVFDGLTGQPVAALDGAAITAIRTAAVSGLATRLLARAHAGDLAILGAGVQGRAHLEAMLAVRDIRGVRVWNRSPDRAADFVRWAAGMGVDAQMADSPAAATAGADLICLCTGATAPVLTAADVADGAHLNAVGAYTTAMREMAADLVARASVWVDDVDAARHEAGDIAMAVADGAIGWDHVRGSLTDLLEGAPVREPGEVTIFKSVGLSVEDTFAAAAVLDAVEG